MSDPDEIPGSLLIKPKRQPWEYGQRVVPVGQEMQALETLGLEGWELCGVVTSMVPVSKFVPRAVPAVVLFLKRPRG